MFLFNKCGVSLHHYLGDFLWSYLSLDSDDPSLRPLLLFVSLPIVPTAESLGLPHRPCQLIQTLGRPHWCLMHTLNPLRHSRRRRCRWGLCVFRCPTILGHSFLIAYHGVIIILIIRDQMVIIEVLILVFLDNQVFPRDKLLLLREGL